MLLNIEARASIVDAPADLTLEHADRFAEGLIPVCRDKSIHLG
jgi:hypothetical protein